MSARQRSSRDTMEDVWALERRLDLEERVQRLAEQRKAEELPLAEALPSTLKRVLESQQRVIEGQQRFIERMQRYIDRGESTEWAREMIERCQVIIAMTQQTQGELLALLDKDWPTWQARRGRRDQSDPRDEQPRSLTVVDGTPKLPAPAAAS